MMILERMDGEGKSGGKKRNRKSLQSSMWELKLFCNKIVEVIEELDRFST